MRVAIVGGGPAGLFAAIELCRKGIVVDLFEKSVIGENIICGECIFDFFGIMPKPTAGLLFDVENFVVRVKNTYRKPIKKYNRMWMIDRKVWQQDLRRQAEALGANIFENNFVSADRLKELQIEYSWVLDASGAPSLSGRTFSFSKEYLQNFAVAYQYEVEADFSHLKNSMYIRYLPGLESWFNTGYMWIFPRQVDRAIVGMGFPCDINGKTVPIKELLYRYMLDENLADAKIIKQGGGFLPMRVIENKILNNIILVGDAAGITSHLSGEGIDLAAISGVLAAQAISEGYAQQYQKQLDELIAYKRSFDGLISEFMVENNFEAVDELFRNVLEKTSVLSKIKQLNKMKMILPLLWKWLAYKPKINPFGEWK